MTDPTVARTADEVTVRITWHDTAFYEAEVKMPRADFQRLREKFTNGDANAVQALESELMTNYNLTRTEPMDWDNLELDVFHEASPKEPDDGIPL